MYDFTNLNTLNFSWSLLKNGKEVANGALPVLDIAPYASQKVKIELPKLEDATAEYHLNLYAKTKTATDLVPNKHTVAFEQLVVSKGKSTLQFDTKEAIDVNEDTDFMTISGKSFKMAFDKKTGGLSTLDYGNGNVILEGIKANFWRPTTDNDFGHKMPKKLGVWKEASKNQE
ncbi:beta-galactosidase domain 4-containing protein, partial [Mariniflexile ostreae]